ncbi:fibronectin type III domain-containing protein [Paenibacillus soyae]|uniref:Fibronectin type III domain-containing protein n=1 Tax=Paenibacillus soyae TaxID=2969249 RepID=A0A9X2MU32_9BACL|nr:fibronectin type III domain-containing protein [Paenibacillus soyae]MCR2806294.1 fibronectin type III domain-containing protein [Paenibacillus soyae]
MVKRIRRKAFAHLTVSALAVSLFAPASLSSTVQAATDAAPVTANWYTTYQEMDGAGAAYAYTPSINMMQLASAGEQDTVRHLLDLTFDEKNGTGHDIVRVIIGDNGGLTASGTAASPGFNPVTSLLADVDNPGFDIEGNKIPMRGTAGQYGYKIEAENRYYDGNTDSIWPNEPEHDPGTLVPLEGFVWQHPSWNQPIPSDSGGPTSLLSAPGEDPVVMKDSARTRKELFDFDQVWTMLQAQQYGVDQFYACVWTVPYWMSNSASNAPSKIIRNDVAIIDGKQVKIYYQAFADYLVHYVKGMWEQYGIPITHVGPFNEVDLAGGSAAYVTELVNEYVGPTLKAAVEPGGALYDIENPDGEIIDFTPQLVAVDGTNLNASISRGGQMFSQVDEATATMKNPYLDVFSTHLYGTTGIGTDETKLYHTGGFSQTPMDYTTAGNTYPQYLTKYKLWQTEFMNQDTGDGSAGAYTNRYGNQNIYDAVRWSNLMTNMFTSNPGFNGFIWWSMWDNNGVDGSDLIRFVTTNSQQEPGRMATLTGEYRLFKRFYGFGHYSRFMNPGDKRFEVTRSPAQDIHIVGFRSNTDFSITVSNAKNDDSVQPLEFTLNQFPVGTSSVTVFRTSGDENQRKVGTIPVVNGKFVIDIPSASIVTIVPSEGTYATYNGLDGERDIFSTLEAERNDNGVLGDAAGNAGRANEAVTLNNGGYLAYNNVNFADGSANGGVVRRHLLYLTAQAKSAKGGDLVAYVLPVGTAVSDSADIASLGREVARIAVPANNGYGKYQDMVETGDLSAYGHKDFYIVSEASGGGSIAVDRFLFGANDSDWSTAANNSTVSIPGNILLGGDFDTATASNTNNWSAGRYDNGTFQQSVTGPALTADTIQSYTGLSRYLKNNSTSRVAGSAKLANRIDAANQYDGIWQEVTGKLTVGESYDFKGHFMSMKHRPESYDVAAENPGDIEVALVYYDNEGEQLALTPISGRDMPEPLQAREAGDAGYWNSSGQFVGRVLQGGPLSLTSFQPVNVKVANWHESDSRSFVYSEPAGTAKVVLAVYAKDSNIMYADLLSLTPPVITTYNVFVDGSLPANFSQDRTDYTYTVNGTAVPVVTASSNDPSVKVSISQASSTSDTAVIRFIKGEAVKTFTVAFSTTQVIDFADGLPAGWSIGNPSGEAFTYNSNGSVTLNTVKQDPPYPNSTNLLQLPGSAEGDWTLTARLTVDKALSDAAFTNATQVGIGIRNAASGEFFRLGAIRVDNSIKVISTGLSGTTTSNNQTGQTSLSGTNYYLRVVKTGNDVQGYFSTNNGTSYTIMSGRAGATVPTTFTPEFFRDGKILLYGSNLGTADLQVTYNDVTLVKSRGVATVSEDQLAVEQAAVLIGGTITVPDTSATQPALLATLAQEYLGNNEELASLGVTVAVSYEDGKFNLTFAKGTSAITVYSVSITGGGNGTDTTSPTWGAGSELTESNVTSTGLTLTWTAAEDDVAVTGYKIYKGTEEIANLAGNVNTYEVTGLTAETEYTFKVEAGDAAGNWSTDGPSKSVTTSTLPDTDAPTWAQGSTLAATNLATTTLTLTWSAAQDNNDVTSYKIYKGAEELATLPGSVTSYEVIGLAPETEYLFKVEAGDEAGNWSADGLAVTVTTLPSADTTAPAWPAGNQLAGSNVGTTGLTLTWTAAEDETAVTAYKIFKDAEEIATVAGTALTYEVAGLTPNSEYVFKVEAGDGGGNWSTNGPSVTVTTLAVVDAEAPTWAQGSALTASSVSTGSLTLTWPAAADNTGVTGYTIYNGAAEVAEVAGDVRSRQVTGLAPNTTYTFSVQARDAAGNLSSDGPTVRVTTQAVSTPPPSTPTPTPSPTPSPTPTPVPTTTPSPTPSPTPTPSPESTPKPTLPPHSFKDVGNGKYDWASEAIDTLYGNGVIKGTSETSFSPDQNITRADFVVLLVRALGLQAEVDANESFKDISEDDYYYESLLIAKQLGIVTGVDGSNFHPNGEISRQDMMVIVARALKLAGKLSSEGSMDDLNGFLDASSVAGYAQESVAALIDAGIIKGDGSSIHPRGFTTRAQAAVVIFRIYKSL